MKIEFDFNIKDLSNNQLTDMITQCVEELSKRTEPFTEINVPEAKKGRGRPRKLIDNKVLSKILSLHKHGVSSRKIKDKIKKEFGVNLHYNTILLITKRNIFCPNCKSTDFIKIGTRLTQQRGDIQKYHCKSCGKKFSEYSEFHHMRNKEEIVFKALRLHNEGFSLREIARCLTNIKIPVHHSTIARWIEKYEKEKN